MEEINLSLLIDTVKTCSSAGKRYCFILGAGASRASGIKTGAEMAKVWLEEMEKIEPKTLQKWIEKNNIDKSDPGLYYSKIYEQRFRLDPASGFIRLQNEMENAIPSPGYYYLAEIIDSTQNKLVITTNFDSLTEDSLYIYKNKNALVITHESLAKYIDALSNRPTVIKLHRDLLLQPKSGEADVRTLSEEWENSLKKIMDIYVPIVIGYGGNDGSLMGFLEKAALKDRIIYWCYKRDNPVNEEIKKLLEKYRGFLIPIDDFDDTMYLFGEHFEYKFSEKTIQEITNKRAEKLINKYKEWKNTRQQMLDDMEKLSDTERMTLDLFKSLSNKPAPERIMPEFEIRTTEEQKDAIKNNEIGDEYYFKNDFNKAIEYYTKAIELDPDTARYYSNRGASYHRLREYEKAIEDHSRAIELEPERARNYNNRGANYSWLKKHEKAIADQSKAIELDPNNARYYNNRGASYHRLKEYKKAIEDHSRAIELDPDNAGYYNNRGSSYHGLKEYKKAIEDHSRAIELDPNNAGYYDNRGANYNWLNEYKKALEDHSRAIELDPDNAGYYFNRASSYNWLNEYEKAIADLSKAIELKPDDAGYYFDLARILCKTGDFDNALINLNKAMSLDSSSAICYNVCGYLGLKKAKHDKVKCKADVLDNLNKAIDLSDDDSFALRFYRDRAEYYLYSNEPEKACDDLQKIITLTNMDGRAYFLMARYYEIKDNTQEYDHCIDMMKKCRYTPHSSDY
jgi:Tfp pilus assembly protein PilF